MRSSIRHNNMCMHETKPTYARSICKAQLGDQGETELNETDEGGCERMQEMWVMWTSKIAGSMP